MMPDLFAESRETMAEGAVLLRGTALSRETALLAAIEAVSAEAPFRHMMTPGGFTMSVAMTTCGSAGWVTDRKGYRYSPTDPVSGKPWPPMPASFRVLAREAAEEAGYAGFQPDSCLINRYEPGTRLSLHQDQDERTTASRSSRSRSVCPPLSCSAGRSAAIPRPNSPSCMAILPSGAARPACSSMASPPSRTACTR